MKKRITFVLALALIVIICVTIFAGCDEIIKKNDKRDATQVVATVSYGGKTANVYYYELRASFNNYAPTYVQYYGLTYEETADYLLKSLAQQKLLVLFATEQVAGYQQVTVPDDISTLLTMAEKDHAIKEVNDSLLESLKSIVESAITEDNYNNAEDEEDDDNEVAEDAAKIYVKFNSQGGSSVDKQQIKVGQKASKPTDPTYDGYSFYGWFDNKDCTGTAVDFDTLKFQSTTTLYAKWVKYTAPRTVKSEEEEEDDYDPEDASITSLSPQFFTDTYIATLYDELKEEDFVDDMMVAENDNAERVLKEYINDGIATLKKNMMANLYKDTYQECYDYYLQSQYETIIIEKYKRCIENDSTKCSVSSAEIEKEYQRLVKNNQETFSDSTSDYESALTSSLSTTYYHEVTVDASSSGYGFVQNILLKLNEDDLATLTKMVTKDPSKKAAVEIERNRLISKMTVKISNPSYFNGDSTDDIDKENKAADITIVDPMTDPNNKYNNIAADGTELDAVKDTKYQVATGNNYNKLISFKVEEGKGKIVYGATEAPTMAYLTKEWPAFSNTTEGIVGIIEQIQISLQEVRDAVSAQQITKAEGIYWLRQVATEWLYMVGDDSGSLSTDSNNNGLGYLITPAGSSSSYLTDFTEYARSLIEKGTGTSSVGTVDYSGVDEYGKIDDKDGFVVADSFIESGSTSGAYAGVFVLLCSYKAWDGALYNDLTGNTFTADVEDSKVLPIDYIISFSEDDEDSKTIYATIEESLKESKKSEVYNIEVNTMAANNSDAVSYNKDVYKALWKDLDD